MKYLILGDGKLAAELYAQTGWTFISRKKNGIDLRNFNSFVDNTQIIFADVIINCIGFTETYSRERQTNWDVNYIGVINLVNWCNQHGKKLIQISTDYVYANTIKNRNSEDDVPVHFCSWYAYTKLLADGYVQAISKNYLLVRTNFKPRPYPWKRAWDNIHGNFDYVDVIGKLIIQLIEKNAQGVYNVGTEPKTYYELAIQTNKEVERSVDHDFLHPINVTMDLTKLHN